MLRRCLVVGVIVAALGLYGGDRFPAGSDPIVHAASAGATVQAQVVERDHADPRTWGFSPEPLEVHAGDTVVWTQAGTEVHTITADDNSFDSGVLNPGDTFSHTFDRVGTYTYHCTLHPFMKGTVRVAAASTAQAAASVPATAAATSPTSAATARDAPGSASQPARATPADPASGGKGRGMTIAVVVVALVAVAAGGLVWWRRPRRG